MGAPIVRKLRSGPQQGLLRGDKDTGRDHLNLATLRNPTNGSERGSEGYGWGRGVRHGGNPWKQGSLLTPQASV